MKYVRESTDLLKIVRKLIVFLLYSQIVRKFREGGYNTLVATCVGEEGLDIGEVDLIVCFDAAKSPIRLVQRMGRTGRKREGRIVVIVSEGKEDQIYNKSQSNKKSIHRAIKDGCRNLVFFDRCPRMVPRYVSPQVHKMHMTIGEFVSSKAGRRGTSAKTAAKASLGAGQAKLGFGVNKKRGKRHAFLSGDELNCWSNELALSDREFRTLEKSVENCFPTQTEFLSIAQLKATVSSKDLKSSQRNSFIDLSTSFANSSFNSSTSQMRKKFHLSLNRWTHCQTAPIPTAVVGHSSKSQQLTSTLEFIDLLNSTDGVGQSYDLEMETFLNREDVLRRRSEDHCQESLRSSVGQGGGSEEVGGVTKKRKVGRVQRFLDESSDEETSQNKKVADDRVDTCNDAVASEDAECFEATVDEAAGELGPECGLEKEEEISCEALQQLSEKSCDKEREQDIALTGFAVSQHIVPRAPSFDSLGWLDEIEPSQMPSSLVNEDIDCSRLEQVTPLSASRRGEEFQFVTPKAPLSSRRSRIQASSTPISSTSNGKRGLSPREDVLFQESLESMNFDDLPANAIFDDFSDTSILSSSKPELIDSRQSTGNQKTPPTKSVSEDGETKKMSLHETSKLMEECVIIDSDSEGDEEELGGIQGRDRQTAAAQDTSCASDDSFLLVHGQRRKRACKSINHVLESPSSQHSVATSPVKVAANVSPGSKENAIMLVKEDSGEWLSTKHRKGKNTGKKVTRFDLSDSSDEGDQFDLPLMQRVGKKARGMKLASVDSGARETGEVRRIQRRVKPKKRKLLDGFVEEEADVSFGEGEGSGDESSQWLQDSREYDMEDSFINDNSMLTQVSPSQRERVESRRCKSGPSCQGNMYLQSLMSPEDHLFGGRKRKVGGSRFRMVFSQRHQILNHYINKAGFNVADSARKSSRRSRRRRSDSDQESEAEEANICYGEEDLAELSQSQSFTDVAAADHSSSRTSTSVSEEVEDKTPDIVSRKRRPGFLLDSDNDTTLPHHGQVTGGRKRLRLSDSHSADEKEMIGFSMSSAAELVQGERSSSSTSKAPSTINRVVISPSLLVSL